MVQVFGAIALCGMAVSILAGIVEQKAPRQHREKLSWVTDLGGLTAVLGIALAVLTAFL